ncbi:MAG: RIP metalloprotease RseP [Bacteroidetes bacterium]|nr:MAG: RIP metalloprotease RseP [Bacteroidota bacterium]TAG86424.1 MAG: RIP metalloprotease RseP [Bacteroidota bacterium]
MGNFIMITQLILGLSLIVGLHELGHLLAAKWFGIRVEKFSIGFPPKIFGVKWGDTEYSFGLIPLGGFVKIAGMMDESFDKEQLEQPVKPDEFRSKPAWQRLIVMIGGVTINVITGIMMFIGLSYFVGESYLPAKEVKYGIVAHESAQRIGLETGDKIIKINGKSFDKFDDVLSPEVLLASKGNYTIDRNGKEIVIDLPTNLVEKLSSKNPQPFIEPQMPFAIGMVLPNSGAEKAGLKEGDEIIEANGKKIVYFHQFQKVKENIKQKEINIKIKRKDKEIDLKVIIDKDGNLGFRPKFNLDYKQNYFGITESITKGTQQAFGSVWYNIQGMGKLFRGEVSTRAVSGPIGIAQVFGQKWDWVRFWRILGILSMWIAFMNMLPIPILDGGHVVFLMYEMISGRKPSDKFMEVALTFGFILIMGLMVFAIANDLFNLFF